MNFPPLMPTTPHSAHLLRNLMWSLQVAQNTWKNADLMRDEALKNQEYIKPAHKLNSKQQQQSPLATPAGAIFSFPHHHQPEDVVSTSSSSLGTPTDTCNSPIEGGGGGSISAAAPQSISISGGGQHQQPHGDKPFGGGVSGCSAQRGLEEAAQDHRHGPARPSPLDDAGSQLSKRRRFVSSRLPRPAMHNLQLPRAAGLFSCLMMHDGNAPWPCFGRVVTPLPGLVQGGLDRAGSAARR